MLAFILKKYSCVFSFFGGIFVGLLIIKTSHFIGNPKLSDQLSEYLLDKILSNYKEWNRHFTGRIQANDEYARNLSQNIRILCYINTYPENYYRKAIHVHNTWAKRCTKHLFMSTKSDPFLPVVALNLTHPEVHLHLWSKMRKILRHIYQYRDQYDYFLKADDDTYVIMENLRHLLKSYSPNDPLMLGHRFYSQTRNGYFSGGAGYVLSREALKRIVEQSIDKHPRCPNYDENMEDVKMSTCGQAVGVRLYNSFDLVNKELFRWRTPHILLNFTKSGKTRWLPSKFIGNSKFALPNQSPLSEHTISFHYVEPREMYQFEYFLYQFRTIGLVNGFVKIDKQLCA